jgi:hypothetical protein
VTARRHRFTHSSTSLQPLLVGAQLGVFKNKDVELHNSQKQDGRMFFSREFGPYQEMNGYNTVVEKRPRQSNICTLQQSQWEIDHFCSLIAINSTHSNGNHQNSPGRFRFYCVHLFCWLLVLHVQHTSTY